MGILKPKSWMFVKVVIITMTMILNSPLMSEESWAIDESDTSHAVSQISELTTIAPVVENKLPIWINLWRKIIPDFNVIGFKKKGEKTIPDIVDTFAPANEFNKFREILYVYSPDRTKFIDPYGGWELFEENGKLWAGRDIDTGVALIDLKNKTMKRLLSCGTPCDFDDAVWIDNNIFVVTGQTEYYPETGERRYIEGTKSTYVATLYIFDLSKNTVIYYIGPETEKKIKGYLSLKFPNMGF